MLGTSVVLATIFFEYFDVWYEGKMELYLVD